MRLKEILKQETSHTVLLESIISDTVSYIKNKLLSFTKEQIINLLQNMKKLFKIDLKILSKKSLILLVGILTTINGMPPIPIGYNISMVPFATAEENKLPNCDYKDIKIIGSVEDKKYACKALDSIFDFFSNLGFEVENKDLTITFEDIVYVDYINTKTGEKTLREVSGYFNAKTGEIFMTSFKSDRSDRTPMTLKWSKEITYSILQHELSHYAVDRIMEPKRKDQMDQPWAECIAYYVQFELMDISLKNKAAKVYSDSSVLTFPWEVNMITYRMNPDKFSYQCYTSFKAHNEKTGRNLLQDILSGDSKMYLGDVLTQDLNY